MLRTDPYFGLSGKHSFKFRPFAFPEARFMHNASMLGSHALLLCMHVLRADPYIQLKYAYHHLLNFIILALTIPLVLRPY